MPRSPPRLLRSRTIIAHSTPTQRRTTEELTFYNDTGTDIDYIILHGYGYRAGMTITDQDGSDLGFFTNEIVKDLLRQSGDEDDKKLLGAIERREKYIQWIVLPKSQPLRADETRVIKVSYTDAIDPARPFGSLARNLFNIPEFKVAKDKSPSESFPSNITILAPEGFRIGPETVEAKLVQEKSSRDLLASDHYHITTSDSIVDVSLPRAEKGIARFRLTYGIYPDKSEQTVLEVFVLALLGISISLLALEVGRLLQIPSPVKVPTGGLVQSLLASLPSTVVLVSLAFIGLTSNPLTHRTKYWTALSLGLSVLTFLLTSS